MSIHREHSQAAMTPRAVRNNPHTHGEVLTAISDGMVGLLKEFYGRGPTRTRFYDEDDLVGCLLRGGFSRVEQTLLEGGRGSSVIQQRMEFEEVMRERFEAVIERATGRRVIGFMSATSSIRTSCARCSSLRRPISSTTARSPRARAVVRRLSSGVGRFDVRSSVGLEGIHVEVGPQWRARTT
jgi:uncharacterized protein YbcI